MKIGIIGPNNVFGADADQRKVLLDKVAKIITANHKEIVLTPDKNSPLEYFGIKYTELGGKKIWLIVPTEELDYKEYLNIELGQIISCKTWDNQANEFNKQSDIIICVGFSWGAIKEIACTQHCKNKKVYILTEFISQKLPEELNFLVNYITIENLVDII